MKVISRYLGYFIRLLACLLVFDLALIALGVVHHLFGLLGDILGLCTLPFTVPVALLYQGIAFGNWTNLVGLIVVLPILWGIGSAFVDWGRPAKTAEEPLGPNPLDELNDEMEKELAALDDDDSKQRSSVSAKPASGLLLARPKMTDPVQEIVHRTEPEHQKALALRYHLMNVGNDPSLFNQLAPQSQQAAKMLAEGRYPLSPELAEGLKARKVHAGNLLKPAKG